MNERSGTLGLTYWLALAIVAALAVVPVLAVDYIPANDYPFHLARIAILSQGTPSSLLGSFYQFGSWLLPNMAMDAFTLPLTRWLSAEAAVKVFLVSTQLAFLGGCVALHRAAFGRYSAWPLLSGLLLYHGIFLYGFYPYLFTAAFALWGAALWMRSRPGGLRLAVAFVVAVVLMWGHMSGFAVFALLVGSVQLYTRLAAAPRSRWLGALVATGLDVLPFVAAMALFLVVSPGSERAGEGLAFPPWWGAKPFSALFALQGGVLWADVLVPITLAVLIGALWLGGQLTVAGPLVAGAAALWLAFILLPADLLGSSFADVRLVPLAAMVTLLALAPRPGHTRWAGAFVLAVALGMGSVKTAALVADWRANQPRIDRIVKAMQKLPAKSTLFAATAAPYTGMQLSNPETRASWHPPLKHVASYASVYGSVFVPMTFADPHKQPMVMMPAYRAVKNLQTDSPFRVPKAADLVAVSQRLTAHLREPGGPALGEVFLLVVGPERYTALPALVGFEVHEAGDGFVIFRATSAADAGSGGSSTDKVEARGG